MTLVWFESLAAVQGFAGADYEKPVISERARALLSRYSDRCDHYELAGALPRSPARGFRPAAGRSHTQRTGT